MTDEFRATCDHWRDIRGVSDMDAAHRIRADQIDILVDLSGHTGNNRLPVFTLKPAPVQVTYLGYASTTGLDSIDYRIVDHSTDPGGADEFSTETLLRLDGCFLCYLPPADAPPVQATPCRESGYITFGSLNHPAKINERVIALWSSILRSVPGSRLLLKGRPLKIASVRERYAACFAEHGIARERVELLAFTTDVRDHLSVYNQIDIALDTFPYNGATTTCEALWMGVPVISLYAERHASRVGLSLLKTVGLAEFAVADEDAYVAAAVRLAADCAALERTRSTLRETMAASPLCNGPAFTRKFEQALFHVWRKWCDGG